MYITSKHIQILRLLNEYKDIDIKDMSSFLSMSNQHIKVHLNDIYFQLKKEVPAKLKKQEIISTIQNFKNSKSILKKEQRFTKEQNIFYLLLKLIENNYFFLSEIAEELEITKRNVNNYILEIKEILKPFNLKLDSSYKGIKLLGSNFNKGKLRFFLIFKFLIEKDFLPLKLRTYCLNLLKVDNFSALRKDVVSLLKVLNCERTLHHEISLLAFFFTFKNSKSIKKIKDISIEDSLKYKFSKYDEQFFLNIITFLKTSSFKEIPTQNLNQLLNIIDSFLYNRNYEKPIHKYALKLKEVFKKYFKEKIYDYNGFFTFTKPLIYYCKIKEQLFIDDFSFSNLNLNYLSNSKIMSLTKDVQKILPTFTLFEAVILWYYFSQKTVTTEKNIFVFKYLSSNVANRIKDEIYKKHNIEIHNCVHSKDLNRYLLKNEVDNIVIIENFKIYEKNVKIKKLFLPLPNF